MVQQNQNYFYSNGLELNNTHINRSTLGFVNKKANKECSNAYDCVTKGISPNKFRCVRARRLKNMFSKKSLPENCKRTDSKGKKKNTGCCKIKDSYNPLFFKEIGPKFDEEKDKERLRKHTELVLRRIILKKSLENNLPNNELTRLNTQIKELEENPHSTRRSSTRPKFTRMTRRNSTRRNSTRRNSTSNTLEVWRRAKPLEPLEQNRMNSRNNEDTQQFKECGSSRGEDLDKCSGKYNICAKVRNRFSKSLKKKYSSNLLFNEYCVRKPTLKSNNKKRDKGCCISKKNYGLGIKWKKIGTKHKVRNYANLRN